MILAKQVDAWPKFRASEDFRSSGATLSGQGLRAEGTSEARKLTSCDQKPTVQVAPARVCWKKCPWPSYGKD